MKPSRTNRLEIPPQYLEALRDRIRKSSQPDLNGCWIWNLARNEQGYGYMTFRRVFKSSAHRLSYAGFIGLIPKGVVVRHKCDVPACVNPEHLELGPQRENALDCFKRGRYWSEKRLANPWCSKQPVCRKGLHVMDEANAPLRIVKYLADGSPYYGRQCQACKQDGIKKYYERKRAAVKAVA